MLGGRALLVKVFASIIWMLGASGSVVAAIVSEQPFRSTFGLVTKFNQGQPQYQLDLLPRLKVAWVRDFVHWDKIEPKAGQYQDWPQAYAQRLAFYKKHDIGVIYVLAYANNKAYPNTPSNPYASIDPNALGRYAVHIAKQLKAAGVRFAIEVWNEPHNFQIMKMVGGRWNGEPPSPWVGHYVNMLNRVHESVAKFDPGIPILSSEDVWVNHYRFAETKALTKSFRHIGLHPYTHKKSTGPEMAAPTPGTGWAKPFVLVDEDRSFKSAIERLRLFTQQATGQTPTVWLTEWGWRVGESAPHGKVSPDDVAAYLPRAFIVAQEVGAQVLCWFSMYDAVDGAYGLISNAGTRRPAYDAYVTMADTIGDARYVAKISRNASRTTGVQAYLFAEGGKRVAVIWSADGESAKVELPTAWRLHQITGHVGSHIPLPLGGDRTIKIDQGPRYVEYTVDEKDDCRASADLECK